MPSTLVGEILSELKYAAEVKDFTDVAKILKRTMQPWGIGTHEHNDPFILEDDAMLELFWQHLSPNIPLSHNNKVVHAVLLYGVLRGIQKEWYFPELEAQGNTICARIAEICEQLLKGQSNPISTICNMEEEKVRRSPRQRPTLVVSNTPTKR